MSETLVEGIGEVARFPQRRYAPQGAQGESRVEVVDRLRYEGEVVDDDWWRSGQSPHPMDDESLRRPRCYVLRSGGRLGATPTDSSCFSASTASISIFSAIVADRRPV